LSTEPSAEPPDAPKKGQGADWSKAMREAAPFIGVGSTMAGALGICLGAGYWLDAKMGTQPWFLLLGSGLGIFAGFYHLFKLVGGQKKK